MYVGMSVVDCVGVMLKRDVSIGGSDFVVDCVMI